MHRYASLKQKSKKEKEIQFEQLQKTQSEGVEMGGGVI